MPQTLRTAHWFIKIHTWVPMYICHRYVVRPAVDLPGRQWSKPSLSRREKSYACSSAQARRRGVQLMRNLRIGSGVSIFSNGRGGMGRSETRSPGTTLESDFSVRWFSHRTCRIVIGRHRSARATIHRDGRPARPIVTAPTSAHLSGSRFASVIASTPGRREHHGSPAIR